MSRPSVRSLLAVALAGAGALAALARRSRAAATAQDPADHALEPEGMGPLATGEGMPEREADAG